ncbi:MAG: sulfite oxidase heme-binding subunit YedZ [Caldilinea sp.]|jgi:sulfoxide reductase heme-binding subunit YedZ
MSGNPEKQREKKVEKLAHAASQSRPRSRRGPDWFWWAVTAAALLPFALLVGQAWTGSLGVDPVNTVYNLSGRAALVTLLLSLACTPLNTLLGWRRALSVRKVLGLVAFFYATVHTANFVGWDYAFDLGLMLNDALLSKPYLLAGSLALGILGVLALTSTRGWMRRLGRSWKRLHRLVYAAGVLAVFHFLWQAKVGERWEPLVYAGLLAALLALRLPALRRRLSPQQ